MPAAARAPLLRANANSYAASLGFATSQLAGLTATAAAVSIPTKNTIVARRICPFLEKTNQANKVSFSNHKTKKQQFVNLQYKKLWWESGKRYVKLRLSTEALKTIEKHRLNAVANKAVATDLNKK